MNEELKYSKLIESASSPVRSLHIHAPTSMEATPEEYCYIEEGTPPYRVHMALWDWDHEMDRAILHTVSHKVNSIEEGMQLYDLSCFLVESFDGLLSIVGILPDDRHVILTCNEPMVYGSWNAFPEEAPQTGKEEAI